MALIAFIGLCPVLDVVFYYTISLIFVVHCVVCGIEIRGLMPKTVFAGLLNVCSGITEDMAVLCMIEEC